MPKFERNGVIKVSQMGIESVLFRAQGGKKVSKKETCKDRILEVLADGEKKRVEIIKATGDKASTVKRALSGLVTAGELKRLGDGWYALPSVAEVPIDPEKNAERAPVPAETSRGETENQETINKMLDAYDLVLDDIVSSLRGELETKASIEEKIDLIKSLRWVAATIDQLMKRWYLVHRGYDTNTRQAVEDAKHKTVEREKQDLENAPPEDQVTIVREYDETMREVLAKLPGKDLKKRTI